MENIKRMLSGLREEAEVAKERAEKAEAVIQEKDRILSEKDLQIKNLTQINDGLVDQVQRLQDQLKANQASGHNSDDLVREANSKAKLAEQEAEAWEKKYLAARREADKYKEMLDELEGGL